jgi:adenylosuccinate synthase
VAYELDGKKVESMPASLKKLSRCVPVYEELPGWQEDIASARKWNDLPAAARNYLKRIEEVVEVPFSIVSVGPGREESIILKDPFTASLP